MGIGTCNGREDKVRQGKTRRYTGKMCILTLGLQRGKWGSIYRKGGVSKGVFGNVGLHFYPFGNGCGD